MDVLQWFAHLDADFLAKFSEGHGRTRRFLTRDPKAIYPDREDLSNYTAEVCHGWWVGTNYSRADVRRLLSAACQVAALEIEQHFTARRRALSVAVGDRQQLLAA